MCVCVCVRVCVCVCVCVCVHAHVCMWICTLHVQGHVPDVQLTSDLNRPSGSESLAAAVFGTGECITAAPPLRFVKGHTLHMHTDRQEEKQKNLEPAKYIQ